MTNNLIPMEQANCFLALAPVEVSRLTSVAIIPVKDEQIILADADDLENTPQQLLQQVFSEASSQSDEIRLDSKWSEFILSSNPETVAWLYYSLSEVSERLRWKPDTLMESIKVLADNFPMDVVCEKIADMEQDELKWLFSAPDSFSLIQRYKELMSPPDIGGDWQKAPA